MKLNTNRQKSSENMERIQFIDKNGIIWEMKILQFIQNDVVVNYNDVIRNPH